MPGVIVSGPFGANRERTRRFSPRWGVSEIQALPNFGNSLILVSNGIGGRGTRAIRNPLTPLS